MNFSSYQLSGGLDNGPQKRNKPILGFLFFNLSILCNVFGWSDFSYLKTFPRVSFIIKALQTSHRGIVEFWGNLVSLWCKKCWKFLSNNLTTCCMNDPHSNAGKYFVLLKSIASKHSLYFFISFKAKNSTRRIFHIDLWLQDIFYNNKFHPNFTEAARVAWRLTKETTRFLCIRETERLNQFVFF